MTRITSSTKSKMGFAAMLLMPYLLWVTFATLLTYTLWSRNPGLLQ